MADKVERNPDYYWIGSELGKIAYEYFLKPIWV